MQYRVTSLGGGWTQVPSISGTGATITGLTASTRYDFQVAAVNAGGTSAFTTTVHGTTATAPSTTAVWGTYGTTIAHGSGGNIYDLNITGGTTPTSVAIGYLDQPDGHAGPMPAPADGWAGNFNGTWWGTYMNAPSTPGRITVGRWATPPETPCSPSSGRRSRFPDVTILFIAPGRSLDVGTGKHLLYRPVGTVVAPPSGGTTPADIAGLAGWWDASSYAGAVASGGVTAPGWNTAVGGVTDRSGNTRTSVPFFGAGSGTPPQTTARLNGILGGIGRNTRGPARSAAVVGPVSAGDGPGSGAAAAGPDLRQRAVVDLDAGVVAAGLGARAVRLRR